MSAESNFGVGGEHKLNLQRTPPQAHFQFELPAPNSVWPQIQQQQINQPLLASTPGQPPFGSYKCTSQNSSGLDGFASDRQYSFSNYNLSSGAINKDHQYDTLPSRTHLQDKSNSFHQSTAHQNYQPYINQPYHPQNVHTSNQPAYSTYKHQPHQRPTYSYGQYPPQSQYSPYPTSTNQRPSPNFLPPPIQSTYGPPPAISYRAPPLLQNNAHGLPAVSFSAVQLVRPPPVIPSSTTSNQSPRIPTLVQSQILHSQQSNHQQPLHSSSQNSEQQQQQLQKNQQREISPNNDASHTKHQLSKKRGRLAKVVKKIFATLSEVVPVMNTGTSNNGIKPLVKKKSRIDSVIFDHLNNDDGADFATPLSKMTSDVLTEKNSIFGNIVSMVTATTMTGTTLDVQQPSSKTRISDDLDPLQLSIAQPLYPLKTVVSEHSLIRMPANLGIRETIEDGGDNESNSSPTMRVTNIFPIAKTASRVKITHAKRPSKPRTFKKRKESKDSDDEDEEDEEADNDETGDWKYNSHVSKAIKKERVESQVVPPPPQIVFDQVLLHAQSRRLSLPESLDLLSVVDIIREFGSDLLKLEGFDDLSFGTMEQILYDVPKYYETLIKLYTSMLLFIYPHSRCSENLEQIDIPAHLSHHFACSLTASTSFGAFLIDARHLCRIFSQTNFLDIPAPFHTAALTSLAVSMQAQKIFHDTVNAAMDSLDVIRKDRHLNGNRAKEVRNAIAALRSDIVSLDVSLKEMEKKVHDVNDLLKNGVINRMNK
ncbi:hypothetical protein HK100_008424, partial [Physocladia obscura]